MKIAPELQHFIIQVDGDGTLAIDDAKRELRALLSVARRARMECNCRPKDNCAMQRALARLDRASGK